MLVPIDALFPKNDFVTLNPPVVDIEAVLSVVDDASFVDVRWIDVVVTFGDSERTTSSPAPPSTNVRFVPAVRVRELGKDPVTVITTYSAVDGASAVALMVRDSPAPPSTRVIPVPAVNTLLFVNVGSYETVIYVAFTGVGLIPFHPNPSLTYNVAFDIE